MREACANPQVLCIAVSQVRRRAWRGIAAHELTRLYGFNVSLASAALWVI